MFDNIPQPAEVVLLSKRIMVFLDRFALIADSFNWTPRVQLVSQRSMIRAHHFRGEFCPLTATVFAETGRFIPCGSWCNAIDYFDLSSNEGSMIVFAADGGQDGSSRITAAIRNLLVARVPETKKTPNWRSFPTFTNR